MVYVTITRYDKDFTLIETPNQQKSTKDSLCTIFNELEKDGYTLIASGGAQELVFVFHKDGIVEPEPKKEVVKPETKKEEKGKDKEEKKPKEGEKKEGEKKEGEKKEGEKAKDGEKKDGEKKEHDHDKKKK